MRAKRIFTGGQLVLVTLFFALAMNAQQTTTTQPAHQLPQDFKFAALTHQNPSYGRHQAVTGAHYGPLVAFNDNNEAAFLADFFDPRTGPVRGVFTSSGQEIAEDGAKIGDITVLQIRATEPFDLQFNARNEVAWIALISGRECGQAATCSALFINQMLTAVTFATPPSGYALGDNGKVTAPAGHSWLTPAAGVAKAAEKGKAASTGTAVAVEVAKHLPWFRLPGITIPTGPRSTPVSIDPVVLQPGQIAVEIAQGIPGMRSAQPGQVMQQKNAPFEVMAQLPYCATPPGGGWPDDWSRNANAAGPIASQRQEYVRGSFVSALHPQVHAWIKKTYYSADCRQIMVAAAESPGVTQEVISPAGMIAIFDAGEGVYRLNGVPPVALPAANNPIEDSIRINKRCAVLGVISFKRAGEDESALILGKPTKGGHCPTE